jgi:choline dehydrogenase-like flavoprotein
MSLTVRRVSTQRIFKIFVGKAKVILSAGTINTACIALNSGIQFLDKSKEALVGKGLIDHAIWVVRFAKLRKSLASPRSPINFQNMIKICGTTALLTVTVNNNFFLAGSSSIPIHQYLDEDGEEVSLVSGGKNRSFEDNNVETINILLEFGAKLRDDNQVFGSGSLNPVIRMRRQETHTDEECQIYMQILATSIRNTVITQILPKTKPELRIPLPWTPGNHGPQDTPIIPNRPPLKVSRPAGDSAAVIEQLVDDELARHPENPILYKKLSETFAPRLSLLGAGVFAHEVGTMRMDAPSEPHGTTNVQGVVDTNLLIHGFDNLYVCDLSVFPYSPEANPTLTLAAISMRLADHLRSMNSN